MSWPRISPVSVDESTRMSPPVGARYLVAFSITRDDSQYGVIALVFTSGRGQPVVKRYSMTREAYKSTAEQLAHDLRSYAVSHAVNVGQTAVKAASMDHHQMTFDDKGKMDDGYETRMNDFHKNRNRNGIRHSWSSSDAGSGKPQVTEGGRRFRL